MDKVGLDDYFKYGGTVEELLTFTRKPNATVSPNGIRDDLPTIHTTNRQLRDVMDECMSAILVANEPPKVYTQSGKLVRLVLSEERASIEHLGKDALVELLCHLANFVSLSQRGQTSVAPPETAIRAILAMPEYTDLPQLEGIVSSPVFAVDGTLHDKPGYNRVSRLYYHAQEPLDLPDTTPTDGNIKYALQLIFSNLLTDFPFADEASKTHALVLLLLPFVRTMIDGPTPLHVIDAPTPGTGKTLQADIISRVFDPNGIPAKSTPSDEAEWKKQLMTWLRQGSSHVLLDNVRSLGSATLQAVLTSRTWSDRLLGGNTDGTYPNRCVWIATANNLLGSREQTRRCVWIRLDAGRDRPDERTGFKHPDLHLWMYQNRANVVGAALTLIRAWIEAGRPSYSGGMVMGSFEAWTRVMGGIMEVIGVHGFLANRQQFIEEADDETSELSSFVEDWWSQHSTRPMTAAKLTLTAERHFGDTLASKSPARSLGRILSKYRGYVISGKVIRVKTDTKNGSLYSLSINAEAK